MRQALWGLALGLIAAVLLAPWTGRALEQLAAARAHRADLSAILAAPEDRSPVLAADQAIAARGGGAARGVIVARIRTLARAGGLLVEDIAPVTVPDPLAAVRFRVSGGEKAVLAFADALERDPPLIRLRSWRIEPISGGVRLSGEALGARS